MELSEMDACQFDQPALATGRDARATLAPQDQPPGPILHVESTAPIPGHDGEFA